VLGELYCFGNQLTELDLANNSNLETLSCYNNQISSLDVSNNTYLEELFISNMPTLKKVCVWKNFFTDSVNIIIDTTGSPNVYFTSDSCIVGIQKTNLSGLTIYPNPANNQITIESTNPEPHTIEIHSLNGKLIYRTKGEGPILQIDLSSFQRGLYFITVRSRDYVRTEKIIKL